MSETTAKGTAGQGRVAVGAQVADGPVLVSPGAGRAGAGRAGPGWPSSDARAGPSASNPTLDRVKMYVKTYVRHLVRIVFSSACVAGRSYGTA